MQTLYKIVNIISEDKHYTQSQIAEYLGQKNIDNYNAESLYAIACEIVYAKTVNINLDSRNSDSFDILGKRRLSWIVYNMYNFDPNTVNSIVPAHNIQSMKIHKLVLPGIIWPAGRRLYFLIDELSAQAFIDELGNRYHFIGICEDVRKSQLDSLGESILPLSSRVNTLVVNAKTLVRFREQGNYGEFAFAQTVSILHSITLRVFSNLGKEISFSRETTRCREPSISNPSLRITAYMTGNPILLKTYTGDDQVSGHVRLIMKDFVTLPGFVPNDLFKMLSDPNGFRVSSFNQPFSGALTYRLIPEPYVTTSGGLYDVSCIPFIESFNIVIPDYRILANLEFRKS